MSTNSILFRFYCVPSGMALIDYVSDLNSGQFLEMKSECGFRQKKIYLNLLYVSSTFRKSVNAVLYLLFVLR